MTNSVHFFGKRFEGGKVARFLAHHDDEAFNEIMEKLDGQLPEGFVAWHIPQSELDSGSKRIEAMKEMPLIVQKTYSGDVYGNDLEALLQAKEMESLVKEESQYLYPRKVVKEQVEVYFKNHEPTRQWNPLEYDILVSQVRKDERLKMPADDTDFQALHTIINEVKERLETEWYQKDHSEQVL